MIALLAIVVYGGYLLPPFGLVMSWQEWFKAKAAAPPAAWRRQASIAGLLSLTAFIPLWAYAAVHEFRNDYSYVFRSAQIGRWSSLLVFIISLFAEGNLRRYLLISAAGLLFFFAVTIGELP